MCIALADSFFSVTILMFLNCLEISGETWSVLQSFKKIDSITEFIGSLDCLFGFLVSWSFKFQASSVSPEKITEPSLRVADMELTYAIFPFSIRFIRNSKSSPETTIQLSSLSVGTDLSEMIRMNVDDFSRVLKEVKPLLKNCISISS